MPTPPEMGDDEVLNVLCHLPGLDLSHLPAPQHIMARGVLDAGEIMVAEQWLAREHGDWCVSLALLSSFQQLAEMVVGRAAWAEDGGEYAVRSADVDLVLVQRLNLWRDVLSGREDVLARIFQGLRDDGQLAASLGRWVMQQREETIGIHEALMVLLKDSSTMSTSRLTAAAVSESVHLLLRLMWPPPTPELGELEDIVQVNRTLTVDPSSLLYLELLSITKGSSGFKILTGVRFPKGTRERELNKVGHEVERRRTFMWPGFTHAEDGAGNAYALVLREHYSRGVDGESLVTSSFFRPSLSRTKTLSLRSSFYVTNDLLFDLENGGRPDRETINHPLNVAVEVALTP